MRKSSVLIRRAAFFAAIIIVITIVVGTSVLHLVQRGQNASAVRDRLLAQAKLLAQSADEYTAGDSVRMMDKVDMFTLNGEGKTGVFIWLLDSQSNIVKIAGESELPETLSEKLNLAIEGSEKTGVIKIDRQRCGYALVPVIYDNGVSGALVAATPLDNSNILAVTLSILAGILAAFLSWIPLIHRIMDPAVKPISELRDVAVAVADGNLDVRANEHINGELGELGKALNNLSYQLSRSMYTLIVERNRLKHMIDGLSEGIVAIDNHGRVTHVNPVIEGMFPKQRRMLHLPDTRMKLIPDKNIWEDFDTVIRTGQPTTRNIESRDMILRITVTPIVDEIGTIAGAVGLFSDITQMERLEKTRRDYVSNVSHELRTPLTAVRALIEPLKEGMVTSEVDRMRYYDIILREVMRLSRLINDQLELSRLQSGTIAIEKKRMMLDDLVYDVCDRYSSIAEEQGLELKILTDFGDCPPVYANADRVEQMLIILLDNAIKYTEEGSVSVSASWDNEKVILSVKDSGIGIDEKDLPYVFDRFYKVDKAHSGKGSGLGLSIAKELLKKMEEDIWVTSEKGEGSEFSFTIHCYKENKNSKSIEAEKEDI